MIRVPLNINIADFKVGRITMYLQILVNMSEFNIMKQNVNYSGMGKLIVKVQLVTCHPQNCKHFCNYN